MPLLDSEIELGKPKRGQRKPHDEPTRWEQGYESPTGYSRSGGMFWLSRNRLAGS
jgi:hypothetical protein